MRTILKYSFYTNGKKREQRMPYTSKKVALKHFEFIKDCGKVQFEDDRRGIYIFIPLSFSFIFK